MLYSSLSCENLSSHSQYDLRGLPLPVLQPPLDRRPSHSKQNKYKGIFKRKKNKEHFGGLYDRYYMMSCELRAVPGNYCGQS